MYIYIYAPEHMFTHTLRDRHDSPRYNNRTKTSTNNNLDNSKSHFQQPPVAELLVVLEKALLLPQVWKSLSTVTGFEKPVHPLGLEKPFGLGKTQQQSWKSLLPSLIWKSQRWKAPQTKRGVLLEVALQMPQGRPTEPTSNGTGWLERIQQTLRSWSGT